MTGDPPNAGSARRLIVSAASRPSLPRYVKLRHDPTRDRWIIQAPERVFSPDAVAVAVLKLCDGSRTVAELAEALSLRYNAPKEQILADIIQMLQDLADKGVLSCTAAPAH